MITSDSLWERVKVPQYQIDLRYTKVNIKRFPDTWRSKLKTDNEPLSVLHALTFEEWLAKYEKSKHI